MTIIGLVMHYLGTTSIIYGVWLNMRLDEKLISLVKGSSWNPGTVWIFIGIGIIIVGSTLILVNAKKKKDRPYKYKGKY